MRDRVGEGVERIRFPSAILPPYARRPKSLEVLIPILHLKRVSTGDFEEAPIALLVRVDGRSTPCSPLWKLLLLTSHLTAARSSHEGNLLTGAAARRGSQALSSVD